MARRDRRGARSGRKQRTRRRAPDPEPTPEPKTYSHPLYGPVPLLVRPWTDAKGNEYTGLQFDPDYQPPLPKGAVRGDPRKQTGIGAFDVPRYFYLDQARRCVQCREDFVFSASEQKYWYEALGFNFASRAIRCPLCRRKQRSEKALHHAVADAKQQLADRPEDPAVLLALAEAIVELHTRIGRGKLPEAIAAARKARRLLAERPASERALTHFWEGRAQDLRGREDKARESLEQFVADASGKSQRAPRRWVERWLDTK